MTRCPEPLYVPSRPKAGVLLAVVLVCLAAALVIGLVYAVVTGLVRGPR